MDNTASSASSNFVASSSTSFHGVGLQNTVHSEIAPNLPLPSLPVFCGADNRDLRLFDEFRNLNRDTVVSQASAIAEMLHGTDVSYLNLRADPGSQSHSFVEPLELYNRVLQCNLEAFNYSTPGPFKENISNTTVPDKKGIETDFPITFHASMDHGVTHSHQFNHLLNNDFSESASRKPKIKKKINGDYSLSSMVDPVEIQDTTIGNFCAMLEDFCGRAEIPSDERDEAEWLSMPVENLRMLVNEIISIRTKKILHLVPVDILVRLLSVLDNQIHRAEGLSIEESELSDSDLSLVYGALESIHASILVMANADMPKQLYKEEIIERILEFSRRQVMDITLACDPSYRSLHKPNTSGMHGGDEDEDYNVDYGSASKKRRGFRGGKMKKSAANKVSAATNSILQKLCTILGFIEDLLFVERLSDGCILQLLKTCFTTFFVDNIHLLQLKALSLISGIFYSYKQHHPHVLDEAVQLLLKLAVSKRAVRAYHLPDEEQRQIQMVTALIIQLVQCSSNLPETLRRPSKGNSVLEVSIDAGFLTKCHEAVTGVCVLFWSRVLQRFTNVKTQDASELKAMMENLVMDLLSTLNLPEFPGAAPLLEVLCVLLLQNAGLKSKDISVRSMAIDLLGLVAARLKHDAAIFRNDKFWIVKDLSLESNANQSFPEDACSACFSGRAERLSFLCQGCHRLFHTNCIGIRDGGAPTNTWHCPFCVCKKQLLVLKSFCNSQSRDEVKQKNDLASENSSITKVEVVQQMLLNHLQEVGSSDDIHLFSRWFYLCFWYKDDPKSVKEFEFYLSRLKSKDIVRDSMSLSSILSRDSVKKITLALGQNSSFSRGFDKILYMLLASLRENSPVIRAKALRAVSIIVEADPEVLFEKRVQSAVEGRFCDSAISAREAALELVGRHIASHPGVGLKYFEKVAERIKDTGVSVRKRAIKIIRDMCTSNSNFTEFTSACIEIISRVTDEESSIQDLVCKTFYEFWFEELPTSEAHLYGDGSSVPLDIAKKTEQIVEMLRRMQSHKLLVTLIKRNLALDFFPQSAKAVGINPILIASVRKRCEFMCKCLLERILQVEEMDSEEVEVRSLPYVLALHAFCIVDPTLCIPSSDPSQFVVTLQPYLKSQVDNRVVAQLLESIIFVIDSVLPLLRKVPQTVLEELEQDLKNMIVRHSFLTVVHACIKCLCSVSKVAGKGATVIEYLIQVFFKRLESLGIDNKQQIGRSLFCLGLLIRYGNSLLVASSNRNVDTSSSLSLFKSYLHSDDFAIKVRSLQALGYVLIARPEYMLEKDVIKILEATLSPGSDIRLKIQALQNMYEYLVDAESQLDANKAIKTVDGHSIVAVNGGPSGSEDVSIDGNAVPVAAGAGDTNICGGIVQLYWDYILGRTLDINEHVRQSALKIVEVVLRQGLVHPITCVPYLIALETDPQEANSKLAHHLLINMNEKYQSFFESRLGDGLQMSFIFIKSMASSMPSNSNSKVQLRGPAKGKSDSGSFASARLGVSRIYRLIRGNRVSRNKFISSIIRKFDTPSGDVSVIPFLVYCTEIMALLPFTVPDEPLYLIYAINRVVQVRAGVLESNMKSLSSQLSHGQRQRKTNENCIQQQGAEHALSYMPLIDLNGEIEQEEDGESVLNNLMEVDANLPSMRSGSTSCISEVDLQKIQADCLAATALHLLLKLKRHLKIVYSLNDARCQAFVPNEPLKAGEVLSRQTISFDVSEVRASLPTTHLEFVERYQEFKNVLREDTVDYSIYTANIKRKRATPRKAGRSSRFVGDRDDEEDNDEDEEWTGGARRINASGRKSSRGGLR